MVVLYLKRMSPDQFLLELYEVCPIRWRPQGKARAYRSHYISQLSSVNICGGIEKSGLTFSICCQFVGQGLKNLCFRRQ